MKKKISISISTETYMVVKSNVDGHLFRNSSHFIEYAITHFLSSSDSESASNENKMFKSKREIPRRGVEWPRK